MIMAKTVKQVKPRQVQKRPGSEKQMHPKPLSQPVYQGTGKLNNKIAFVTGGDSGIGKAVALLFAKEGADLAIVYLNENKDAEETKKIIEGYGRQCLLIRGDL